jgi:hypothetical protein
MILLQDPLPIIIFGVITVAVLAVALLRTGRGVLLFVILGVIGITLAGVGIEWLVITEQEHVEAALDATAIALESNDRDAVLACCASSADHTRSEARRALRYVEFIKIKINALEIDDINYLTAQPTVTARFTALISARDRKGDFGELTRPISFTVRLRKESDRWLITSHEIARAPAGFGKKPLD